MSGAANPTLPKCRDCGKRTARVVSIPTSTGPRQEWLCASCEYLRAKPDAPRAVRLPRERSKRLQKETLLDALDGPAVCEEPQDVHSP